MFSRYPIALTLIILASVCVLYNASANSNAGSTHNVSRNKEPRAGTGTALSRYSPSRLSVTAALPTTDSWFTSSDVSSGDNFGTSVALSGSTVVIGAPHDSDAFTSSGSAYVFVRDGEGWAQQQKLTSNTPSIDQNFGSSVAISGDTIVVGAYGESSVDVQTGAAYVFVRNEGTWSLQQKLTLSDPMGFDGFGQSVGISGDTIIVGAVGDSDDGSLPGSASVFVRDSAGVWSLQQKLRPHDAVPGDMFGFPVAISGNTALVSDSFFPANNGNFVGSVYVYERVGTVWSERQKLQINPKSGAEFGRAISIDGDTFVVGAIYDAHGSNTQGSAYVYVRTGATWSQQQKLFVRDSPAPERFGTSVAINAATIVVGNNFEDEHRGSAYVFVRDAKSNWKQQFKLTADDGLPEDYLGTSVATNGSVVLAGAVGKTVNGPSSGAVYYWSISQP